MLPVSTGIGLGLLPRVSSSFPVGARPLLLLPLRPVSSSSPLSIVFFILLTSLSHRICSYMLLLVPVFYTSLAFSPSHVYTWSSQTGSMVLKRRINRNNPTQPLDCYKQVDTFKNIVGKLEKVSRLLPSDPCTLHLAPCLQFPIVSSSSRCGREGVFTEYDRLDMGDGYVHTGIRGLA